MVLSGQFWWGGVCSGMACRGGLGCAREVQVVFGTVRCGQLSSGGHGWES